jgi:acyl-CoA synthetase (AMP-forming)/AMP-acid ligase II
MLMHRLILAGAERHPERVAVRWVDRDRAWTYAEVAEATERMAGALASLGVQKGDRVTVFAHNGLDYVAAMLGAWRLGAIAALVNVRFEDELDFYFADHTPKVVVYTHDMGDKVRAARKRAPSLQHLVCMDGPQPGAHALPDLMVAALPAPADPGDETAIAHLSYTSGTTGKPKGACLAHEPTIRAARCIGERLRIRGDDVSFGPTALSSSYQLVGNLLPEWAAGATVNIMGRWTQGAGFEAIDSLGATLVVGNPPLLEEILAESRAKGHAPGRLRFALSGGGPVPPTLKQAWRDELKIPLVESYGQSELGGFVALGYPELEPDDAKLMRIGPALPDKEVAVCDLEDLPLPAGRTGELCLRGGFMVGYWGKPDKTAQATRGGWLRTGDVGFLDADGFVTMRGRRSELIEVAGVTWFPRDVEEALQRVPGVRLAALIGLPDAVLGARPAAYVTLHEGRHLMGGRLKEAIAGKVPYDVTPLTVTVLDKLPMTPTGKISKAELAAERRGDG